MADTDIRRGSKKSILDVKLQQLADVPAWAKSPTKPTYTPAEVGAAPAVHNHDSSYLGKTEKAADSDKLGGKSAGNASGNIPISNGTLNTNLNVDLLDGLHAGDFPRLFGVGYVPDYGDFVIGLAHAGGDPNLCSGSFGFLYGIRFNGVNAPYIVRVGHQKIYNSEQAHVHFAVLGNPTMQTQHACVFTYNGVRYSGIRCRWDNPGFTLYFQGITMDMAPFLVCMRNGSTGEIYNYEIWNSLSSF